MAGKEKPKRRPDSEAARAADEEWLVVSYRPLSLFSLRMTHATSKGGKTLVAPTPYSIKMALLDACFRRFSAESALASARGVLDWLVERQVCIRPPKHCIVNNTFMRVLDWDRDEENGPFKRTIAYREFVWFGGDEMKIALLVSGMAGEQVSLLTDLFAHVTSFGKRGSLFQFVGSETLSGELPFGFTVPRDQTSYKQKASYALTQSMDDFGSALATEEGFDRVSTYGSTPLRLGEHRNMIATAVPYQRRSAARHFTWYERVDEP